MHILYWGNGNPFSRVGTRTRHDHILAALRKRPDVERIHYVDTSACLRFNLCLVRAGSQSIEGQGPDGRVLAPVEIYSLHNRIPFTNRFRVCKRFALRVMAWQVGRSIKRRNVKGAPLIWWICNARFWPVLEYAAKRAHRDKTGILDCVDHMAQLWKDRAANAEDRHRKKWYGWVAREYEIGYERSAIWAARIAVNSAAKLQIYLNLGATVELVPSGVDVDRFEPVVKGEIEEHPSLMQIPKPRVGYIGPLYQMVDTELLRRAASALGNVSFIVVGDVERQERALLQDLPNMHLLGPQEWESIPAFFAGMDVVLSIYRREVSAALGQSLKVIEGLAAGRSVVAVNAPLALENLASVIRLARSGDEFIAQLKAALDAPPATLELRVRRTDVVRFRSWDAVAEEILSPSA